VPSDHPHDYPVRGITHYFIYAVVFFVFDAFAWVFLAYAVAEKGFTALISFTGYLAICGAALACLILYVGGRLQ